MEVFEPVVATDPLELRVAHNAIRLWTWGGEVCTLRPRAPRPPPCGTRGWTAEESVRGNAGWPCGRVTCSFWRR